MKSLVGLIFGIAIFSPSCHSAPPTNPKQLTDGCYYSGGKAVFKINGAKGHVLVPGEVSEFKVERGGDAFRAWATFTPGILFDMSPPSRVLVEGGDDAHRTAPLTFDMKSGTSVPTIAMHLAAYGETEARLGRPC